MSLSKYQKFSIFYFPVLFLVTWIIYEAMYPHYDYSMAEQMLRGGFFAFGFLLLLLAVTGIPSFWLLKKRDIGIKAKVLMVVVIVALVLFLTPLAYSSHVNKSRLQWYVQDLRSHGVEVQYQDHYSYGHWIPTWIDNYTEFVDIAISHNHTVYVSGGVPYHFFIYFPRAIEMVCAIPYTGFYILRIE